MNADASRSDAAAPPAAASVPARAVRLRLALRRLADVLSFAARRAADARLAQVAGSLTFTTVLSLVPLLAVVLAIFTAFPLFSEFRVALEKNIFKELLPGPYSAVILRYLNDFAAKATRLTAFGLIFLVCTALMMTLTVDRVLNDIWRVRQRRPLAQRLLIYWALLTLGPLLAGASLSVSSYLMSMSAGLVGQLPKGGRAIVDYAPLVLSGFAFAALYVVVPARPVAWRDALLGGFTASLLGELLKDGFSLYIKTGTVSGIYGAFAVVPLFLLWVYLSWFAVLFGAAIAATLPLLRTTRFSDEGRAGNAFLTAVAMLRLMLEARLADRDGGRLSVVELARQVHTHADDVESLLAELEQLDYVSRIEGPRGTRWLLTCDPSRVNLVPLFSRIVLDPGNTLIGRDGGRLGAWLHSALQADWIRLPLLTVFRSDEVPAGTGHGPGAAA